MQWTSEHNKLLLEWLNACDRSMCIHAAHAQILQRQNMIIALVSIILGALLTLVEGITLIVDMSVAGDLLRLFLAAFVTCIVALSKHMKLGRLSSEHMYTSQRYYAFALDLRAVMCRPVGDRPSVNQYIDHGRQMLVDIRSIAPAIHVDTIPNPIAAHAPQDEPQNNQPVLKEIIYAYDSLKKRPRPQAHQLLFDRALIEDHGELSSRLEALESQQLSVFNEPNNPEAPV